MSKDNKKKLNKNNIYAIDFNKLKEEISTKKIKKSSLYKEYKSKVKNNAQNKKKDSDNNKYNQKITLNLYNVLCILVALFFVLSTFISIKLIVNDYIERERLHVVSEKESEKYSEKDKLLQNINKTITSFFDNNLVLSVDNLNFSKIYEEVYDEEDKKYLSNNNNPEPAFLNDERDEKTLIDMSVAGQVYKKLKLKNDMMINEFINMANSNPVNIVRKYMYSGFSILGNYNPKNSTHVKGKYTSYFIDHFSNTNIYYKDNDGNDMDYYKNIQDIMSMGSIYTYYHDAYNSKLFMNYCYDLYDRSITYVASISEVYYCSGCMDYEDPNIESKTVTISHIPMNLNEQKNDDIYEQKAGVLDKIDLSKIKINTYSYDEYKNDIIKNGHNKLHNYCPGHVDLNIYVTCKCLDDANGLINIDQYGNSGRNYIESWHGWDKQMIIKAKNLSNKDWELEYGLKIDDTNYLKPLCDELVNYYLCTLPDGTSKDRMTLIETALRSVSRIPYYYAGKPHSVGYESNGFNERVKPDYNGRVLKGLDCSGWIMWVYWTAFNKRLVKNEGTIGQSREGTRIQRYELKPGDLIVRPGYDSHVMMFMTFEADGKVKVIHENGSMDNVSIGTYEAYYPYYRRIFTN